MGRFYAWWLGYSNRILGKGGNRMDDILLEGKGLSFSYEKKPVLKNICFSVKRGEKIAVMGPNGAGSGHLLLTLPLTQ